MCSHTAWEIQCTEVVWPPLVWIIFEQKLQWHWVNCAEVTYMVSLIMITASETLLLRLCVYEYFSNDLWHFELNFSPTQNQRLIATSQWSKEHGSCHSPSGIYSPWFCAPWVSQDMGSYWHCDMGLKWAPLETKIYHTALRNCLKYTS